MSSKYTSLLDHWNKALTSAHGLDEVLESIKKELTKTDKYISSSLFIQDYRDFGLKFVSENVFDMSGYYPEHFYEGGIEFGLKPTHPEDLLEILKLQKLTFDYVSSIPIQNRLTYHGELGL